MNDIIDNAALSAQEAYRQYMQFCDECSKAHDFTCSGADAAKCEAAKEELLKRANETSK